MEKQVIFRDYQEQQADDHQSLQEYAQQSLDHVVYDAVTGSRAYAGFHTQKTAQAEVQVAVGRFYETDGAIYVLDTITVQSMVAFLASSSKRYVTLSASGAEVETDTEERDFLVDVDTGLTEPRAVTTTKLRQAVLTFTSGTVSADPQLPTIPSTHVRVADILVDTTSVVSVTMNEDNQVNSTEEIDERTETLEDFKDAISARVTSLAADLAALEGKIKPGGSKLDIIAIYKDLARLKELAQLPDTYSQYGADNFLTTDESDTDNSQQLGYTARVEEGCRFPKTGEYQQEIHLFSDYDTNAALHIASGILLPKYTEELKLQVGPYHSDVDISQYTYQTFALKEGKMTKTRLRFGGSYLICVNGVSWWEQGGDPALYWLTDYTTWMETRMVLNDGHYIRYQYWWHDSWKEPYWYIEWTDHNISGALVAESFLIANDVWLTKVGFYVTQKGGAANISVSICELTAGVPDLSKTITHTTHNESAIVVGWNRVAITPTFLARGKRYALVLISPAAHRIGLAYGSQYAEGTFFYSTDGAYYLGDLTKDMMFELWGARFNSPQVTIDFTPLSLNEGIYNIDIMARSIVPASCELIYEVLPTGAADWIPLTKENGNSLTGTASMCQFRGRFVGTRDIAPALTLAGSIVYYWHPGTSMTHVSEPITLAAPSTDITVEVLVENFNETPHNFDCVLHNNVSGASPVTIDHIGEVTELENVDALRYRRSFHFTPAATNNFTIVITASTNLFSSQFHIAERLYYAL